MSGRVAHWDPGNAHGVLGLLPGGKRERALKEGRGRVCEEEVSVKLAG